MKKLILVLIFVFLHSATITSTKKELKYTSYKIAKMNKKLDSLAKKIIKKQIDNYLYFNKFIVN